MTHWRTTIAIIGAASFLGSQAIGAPQPLHFCLPPTPPIENEALLARHGMTVQEEYSRYFDDLNSYLLCLQRSQNDIIEKSRVWHDRYIELFGE